ncbi:hypothetical protein [Microvirga mediterraneensis]|uniref:Uncharacterized protein n=1 Tax=Microvirga mediterraneensis TaxID=2754695 RepID=A0A838BVJ6_9HYPH|nr:hypothetical protein [Microvirga mediterraneensis]MBA1159378.1 hypothetical protein [Microvirga mediterraneensis]
MTPPPLPRAAPEPAKLNDENVTRARDDATRRARAAAGAGSTIRAPVAGDTGTAYGTKQLLGQ